jgi:hypothetical protein
MMNLVHSHSFPRLYDLQKEKTWKSKDGMNVSDRVGKRVGILGYGSIGRQGTFSFPFKFSRRLWWKVVVANTLRPRGFVPRNATSSCAWPDTWVLDERLQYSEYYAVSTLPKTWYGIQQRRNPTASREMQGSLLHVSILRATPSNPSPAPPWQPYRLHNPTSGERSPSRLTSEFVY